MTLSRFFALEAAEVEGLVAEGRQPAPAICRTSASSPTTWRPAPRGSTSSPAWTPPALGGATALSFVFNHTDTAATDFNPALLNPDQIVDRIRLLEEALPDTRWSAAVDQSVGRGTLLARLSYYGGWYDRRDTHRYRGKPTVDLELAWPFGDAVALAGGARNLLSTYPDMNPNAGRLGNRYPPSTPFGFDGGFLLHAPRLPVGEGRLRPRPSGSDSGRASHGTWTTSSVRAGHGAATTSSARRASHGSRTTSSVRRASHGVWTTSSVRRASHGASTTFLLVLVRAPCDGRPMSPFRTARRIPSQMRRNTRASSAREHVARATPTSTAGSPR